MRKKILVCDDDDEFAVVLPETSRSDARAFVRRFNAALAKRQGAGVVPISAAAGLAVLGEDAVDAAGLRSAADRALYRDKAAHQARKRDAFGAI